MVAKMLSLVLGLLCITAYASPANSTVPLVLPLDAIKPVTQPAKHGQSPPVQRPDDMSEDDESDDDAPMPTVASKVEAPATAAPAKFLATASAPPASTSETPAMTAAAMEAAMTDLMLGKTAFGATPMGGSVKQIKDLITKTMMPKVKAAHTADQNELNRLIKAVKVCGSTKKSALKASAAETKKYKSESKSHKTCRSDEAVKFTTKKNCLVDQKRLLEVKKEKCKFFSDLSNKIGTQKDNKAIVTKAGGESAESYVTRISATICGKHVHGPKGNKKFTGGWGGGLAGGFLDRYLRAKDACEKAKKKWEDKVKECKKKIKAYNTKKAKCDQYQGLMDSASCKSAILAKDACESYAECYHSRVQMYKDEEVKVRFEEIDRKAEWRGLNRMSCFINAFADGKVTGKEVDACKKQAVNTKVMNIKYPKIPALETCVRSQLYPSTGSYKKTEFAVLPDLAKGKESIECSGVQEISTKPNPGSPKSCKCKRVTLNGYYSPGPMVACKNCFDVSKNTDKNSCPRGTKIFAPATRGDWKTFLASAKAIRAPSWIIDITKNGNGCGGCQHSPMNSQSKKQSMWGTSDGSAWWLRSTKYGEPNGNYHSTCYLGLRSFGNENSVTFDDNNCKQHAKSYYCQNINLDLDPNAGSPKSCRCKKIDLTGSWSAGDLVKCEQCIDVHKSTQKNSCPQGMKIFSPRSRSDWKTFLKSAGPLAAPHFIIDVTRPENGCGGCTRYSMKSTTPQQATWRTSDRSPWWLRSSSYGEPNGDYTANCYLHLWKTPHNSANNIQFNDGSCGYHSKSYYCQPVQKPKPKPTPAPAPPPPPPVTKMDYKGFRFYLTKHGQNCDSRCKQVGGTNVEAEAKKKIGDNVCNMIKAFYPGLKTYSFGTGYYQYGYKYDKSTAYCSKTGKSATARGTGTQVGQPQNAQNRKTVCPCFNKNSKGKKGRYWRLIMDGSRNCGAGIIVLNEIEMYQGSTKLKVKASASSSQYASYNSAKTSDGNPSNYWASKVAYHSNPPRNEWITYDFGKDVTPTKLRWKDRGGSQAVGHMKLALVSSMRQQKLGLVVGSWTSPKQTSWHEAAIKQ